MFNIPESYNVQFLPRNTVETYQMMVADIFGQRLFEDDWSRRMLFPDKNHAILLPERELGRANFDLKWIDEDLNYEQQVFSKDSKMTNRNPWTRLSLDLKEMFLSLYMDHPGLEKQKP